MALPVSDVPVTLGASGRCPAWYSTMPLASLALPFPEVSNVTASAPASSTATTAVTVTTVRRLALNTSGALTAVASRGDDPPYPRCPAGAGLIAKPAIVSGPLRPDQSYGVTPAPDSYGG